MSRTNLSAHLQVAVEKCRDETLLLVVMPGALVTSSFELLVEMSLLLVASCY